MGLKEAYQKAIEKQLAERQQIFIGWWDHVTPQVYRRVPVFGIDAAHAVARVVSVALENQYIKIETRHSALIAEYCNGVMINQIRNHKLEG